MVKQICCQCQQSKGKRECQRHQSLLICPTCCARTRTTDCDPCQYYTTSVEYQQQKQSNKEPSVHYIEENDENYTINESYPDVIELINHALELIKQGSFIRAKQHLKQLIKDYPENDWVHFGWGVYFLFNKDFRQAEVYFTTAIRLNPENTSAYYNLASIYQVQLDIDKMIGVYQKIIEIGAPDDELVPQARERLKELDDMIRRSEGLSLDTFLKGKEHFQRGVELMSEKKWEQAIASFLKVLQTNKNHTQSHGNIGICYMMTGSKQLAREAFNKALELDPEYQLALDNLKINDRLNEGEIPKLGLKIADYYKENFANRKIIKFR